MKKMDREYAELSLRVGVMASAIDDYFGTDQIMNTVRENAWGLTPELLTTMWQGARNLGVPQSVLDDAVAIADEAIARDPEMKKAIALQNEYEARKVH